MPFVIEMNFLLAERRMIHAHQNLWIESRRLDCVSGNGGYLSPKPQCIDKNVEFGGNPRIKTATEKMVIPAITMSCWQRHSIWHMRFIHILSV